MIWHERCEVRGCAVGTRVVWRNWTLIRIPVDLYQLHIFELVSYLLLPDSFFLPLSIMGDRRDLTWCLHVMFRYSSGNEKRVSSDVCYDVRTTESLSHSHVRHFPFNAQSNQIVSDSFPTDAFPTINLEERTRPVSLAPAISM